MDDADKADERIEQIISDGINKARRTPNLKPINRCYYCNEPVPSWRVFCGPDCAQDWEWLQGNKGRNGNVL